ncbi:hypothetical protein ACFWBN_08040 [Streptomyces sp. NPDC059989]|uniref:hypothetical protein n=1 Tax=Streptomyces sp. NPDC059989 TaxID=3347026 RepID=UPI0036A7AA0D
MVAVPVIALPRLLVVSLPVLVVVAVVPVLLVALAVSVMAVVSSVFVIDEVGVTDRRRRRFGRRGECARGQCSGSGGQGGSRCQQDEAAGQGRFGHGSLLVREGE